jgi:hypothetical protein
MPTQVPTQSVASATIAPSGPVRPAPAVKTRTLQAEPKPEAAVKVPPKAASKRGSKPSDKKAAIATKSAPITSKAAVKTPAKPIVKKQIAKVGEKSVGVGRRTPVVDKALALKQEKRKSGKAKAAHHRSPKIEMVRDSFTFPKSEHKRLAELKKRLIALGTEVKKGELVRAALGMLFALDNEKLIAAVAGVEKLKTGRPTK